MIPGGFLTLGTTIAGFSLTFKTSKAELAG